MKKLIASGLAGVVIVVGVVAVLANTLWSDKSSGGTPDEYVDGGVLAKDCEERDVDFTHWPVDPAHLKAYVPMGAVSSEHVDPTDHGYFITDAAFGEPKYPLVAPADGYLVRAFSLQNLGIANLDASQLKMDVGVTLQLSCRYFAVFYHLHEFSAELAPLVGEINPEDNANGGSGSNKDLRIPVKAGQTLGLVGMSSDFLLIDTQHLNTGWITPSYYSGEPWKKYVIDPFTVYLDEVVAPVLEKNPRKVAPYGGKIDLDVAGSAQGTWFVEGHTNVNSDYGNAYWKYMVSLVPHFNDPDVAMVSVGEWNGEYRFYLVKEKFSFTDVTDGNPPTVLALVSDKGFGKYDPISPAALENSPVIAHLVVSVTNNTLTLEIIEGSLPPTDFSGSQRTYVR